MPFRMRNKRKQNDYDKIYICDRRCGIGSWKRDNGSFSWAAFKGEGIKGSDHCLRDLFRRLWSRQGAAAAIYEQNTLYSRRE